MIVTRALLERLPKAELHVHLDGSLRPGTMVELAAAYGKPLPESDPERLRTYMHVRDASNLVEYLDRFAVTLSVMQTAEALERIAYELAEDLAGENVRYAEIRYSPILNTREGLPLTAAVDAPLRGLESAAQAFGIRTNLIICGIRNMDPATSQELADLTVAYKGRGVVAFDLAGAEYNYPAKKHREAFYTVINKNMAATIHAGEAYGPESIHQALHYCKANRIGHGTRLYEDPVLRDYIRDRRLLIETNITSNVQTRAVARASEHPVRQYLDAALAVTLCTDGWLMTGVTLSDEYWLAHTELGFTRAEIDRCLLEGFANAFLPWPERRAMVERVRGELATLR